MQQNTQLWRYVNIYTFCSTMIRSLIMPLVLLIGHEKHHGKGLLLSLVKPIKVEQFKNLSYVSRPCAQGTVNSVTMQQCLYRLQQAGFPAIELHKFWS